jgi:hypothetical protein
MGNITTGLVIVLAINVMLFLGQAAATDLNPTGTNIYDGSGSLISDFEGGNYTMPSDPASFLPSGESSVNPETGNIFTDTFSTSRSWMLEKTGLSYLLNMLSAPAQFMYSIGLPAQFSWAIGSIWYAITLFLIAAFILGRDT